LKAPWYRHTGGGFYVAHEAAWKTNYSYKMSGVIVKGGSILSVGFNRISDHPAAYYGCSFHAETDAIKKAKGNIVGAKLFVYRFGREKSELRPSKPCSMCQQEIAKAGISSVYFIDTDMKISKESYRIRDAPRSHNMHCYMGSTDIYTR
jgi:deoxycytidylate deaminase